MSKERLQSAVEGACLILSCSVYSGVVIAHIHSFALSFLRQTYVYISISASNHLIIF